MFGWFERYPLRFLEHIRPREEGVQAPVALLAQTRHPFPEQPLLFRRDLGSGTPEDPVQPCHLLVHALQVTGTPQATAFMAFKERQKIKRVHSSSGFHFQMKVSRLRIFFTPLRGTIAIKLEFEGDDSEEHRLLAFRELGQVLHDLGGLSRWRITRIDVAVDYPVAVLDLLVSRRQAAYRVWFNELPQPPGFHSGTHKHFLIRQYERDYGPQRVTRIEAEVRYPKIAGQAVKLLALQSLPNPFKLTILHPLWGRIVGDEEAVYLRLLQRLGKEETKEMIRVAKPPDASKRELRRTWDRVLAAIKEPRALAMIEQPREAFERLWDAEVSTLLEAVLAGSRLGPTTSPPPEGRALDKATGTNPKELPAKPDMKPAAVCTGTTKTTYGGESNQLSLRLTPSKESAGSAEPCKQGPDAGASPGLPTGGATRDAHLGNHRATQTETTTNRTPKVGDARGLAAQGEQP